MKQNVNKEFAVANICKLAISEAQDAGCRTVRPEHILLAMLSSEPFFASHLKKAGFEKEALSQTIGEIDLRIANRETVMDKLFRAFFNCLQVDIPPYSTAFYRTLKRARRRSRSMRREVITYPDFCYALLLDNSENSMIHESLKRLGLDPRALKLALEAGDSAWPNAT
jgi:ATP-dependent Clp protease ATP-binding subunit ClpA